MTVLLVSSTASEFSGLTGRFSGRKLDWPLDYAVQIEVAGADWILVANGAGIALAGEAFRVARKHAAIHAVVSTGYCGALDPALQPAEVVVATQVLSGGKAYTASGTSRTSRTSRILSPVRLGPVAGADRIVASASDKRQLHEATGAATVDMESHGLASEAAAAGIPFYCIRAVTDTAREDMHVDFNAARDEAGRIQPMRLAAASLRRPLTSIPELCKLAFRARRASQNLGDFLADCRF